MKKSTRRNFLKSAFLTAASLSIPVRSWAQVAGANSNIRVATVGFNGRGGSHISGMLKLAPEGVRMVALCDVDSKVLNAGVESFKKRNEPVEGYGDIRKLLENKNVDAITIATPNHWHSLAAIWSIQAGKDVYVEKPVSHNVWEGRKVVEAARTYDKIVQTGTQARSSHALKEAVEWVQAGNLGKILLARGLCYKPRGSIGKTESAQPVPNSVDYDLWCGPAPKDELRRAKLHYDWHWIWNYGNGDLGNQGIHQMDIARWFLGEKELSPRVLSVGGRLGYLDDGQTPNTQIVYHDYAKAPLIFEVRGLPEKTGSKNMDKYPKAIGGNEKLGTSVGVIIECEGGMVVVTSSYGSAIAYDKEGKEIKKFSGDTDHFENFIQAVRSRKHTDLHADILEGHLSSALCHTGNISYRLGKQASSDEIREQIKGDRDASATFARMQEHLTANDVDLSSTKATLGVPLKMDPWTEKFVGNAAANALLTREYRKPYVVPERV